MRFPHQPVLARLLPALLVCWQAGSVCLGADVPGADQADRARRILAGAGVEGGLVVHVGCAGGRLTAALRPSDSFLVHGLDTDPRSVEQARRHVRSRGLYGKVAVDTFDGRRLPYVDNLVNLLVTDDLGTVPMEEVTRVLAPLGVAMIGGTKTVKPWPDGIDPWSHYLHGPDNNAVAQDRVVGPPRHMQWLAGPKWTRHHHADKGTYPAIRAVVSSRGRLFYMVDETKSSNRTVPSKWFLAARDGFSGVLLWNKPLEADSFERRLEQVWRTLIADGERVYAPLGTGRPLSASDAATGAVIRSYRGTEGLQEVIKEKSTLFVVRGQNGILALRADTGDRLWQWEPDDDDAIVPLTLAASEEKVFVKTDKGLCCLSADEGKMLWATPLEGPEKKIRLKWPREKLLVADGRVLVAQVDAHTVHALDANSGRALWHFTTGARVDSPPTLYRGLVLFGSRDGWVYCLRASDGGLAWRFLAAPQRINAVAYEQVESLWPVHGSVLIHDGVAYVAAGRSSYLDGGIVLYGLNPQTGRLRCTTSLRSEHASAIDPPPKDERAKMQTSIRQNNTDYKTFLAPDRSDAFSMRGALPDVLVADGQSIFMRHLRFDGRLARLGQKRPHLFSTSSLLDDAEHHRSYWVLGTGDFGRTPVSYPWIVGKSLAVPYGLMMVFNEKTVWAVRRVIRKSDPSGYVLFATPRPDASEQESALPDFQQRLSAKKPVGNVWTTGLPLRPRAMVRADNHLFIGGMPDHVDPGQPSSPGDPPLEAQQGGLLQIVACSDGETLASVTLESPPVWDGMAVANNRLFISSTGGSVQCWGTR